MPPPKKRPQKRAPQQQQRSARQPGRPQQATGRTAATGPAKPFFTPNGSPLRRAVERRSAPLLVMLTRGPRLIMMLLPLALLLLGLFLPLALGLIALAIFLLFTGWLAYLSWPKTDTAAKAIRVVMFALVVGLVVLRLARA